MIKHLVSALLVAVVLCSTLALAQDAAQNPPFASALHQQLKNMQDEFVPAAEAMPEDKYGFAPSEGEFKGVRTFAQQVKHVAAAQYLLASAIAGEKNPVEIGANENGPDNIRTKAEILKFLEDSFAYAHKALDSITDQNATAPIKALFGPGQTTRSDMAVLLVGHGFNHYGQMVVYLRMNGIVPPASRPRPQQK